MDSQPKSSRNVGRQAPLFQFALDFAGNYAEFSWNSIKFTKLADGGAAAWLVGRALFMNG